MKKVVLIKKLYSEIHRWENRFGVSNTNIVRLMKLYIGMDIDFLITRDGKIYCRDFNKVAKVLRTHNPKMLISMAVNSGSFIYEKCNSANMNHYGVMWIASTCFASQELVTNWSDSAQKTGPNFEHNLDIINNIIYTGHSADRSNGTIRETSAIEHPHGEYEYVVTGCTQRLYDIDGAAAPIPANAPDRPDGSAVWNKFLNKWITKNSEI